MDDDQLIERMSLEEKISALMSQLPTPIQNFLVGSDRSEISLRLSQKYRLHADTAGIFEQAFIYMLLGVFTPEEFIQKLKDGGLDEETVRGLTTDVNEQVFKKLRDLERAYVAPVPTRPSLPSVPLMQVGEVLKITPQMVSEEGLPTVVTPALVVTPPPPSIPNIPAYEEATLQTYKPVLRTMASDMEALAHPNKIVETNASQPSPARSFQTSSVPKTEAMGQIFLPRVSAVFESPKSPEMSIEPPTFRYHEELSVPSTPSTSRMDPYREPVE